jgi:uncharacterized protein YegL
MMVVTSERRGYPIYILLDVSASMRRAEPPRTAPLTAFKKMIPDLIMSLSESRSLAKAAWISVIAFSDQAEMLCSMSSLAEPVSVRDPRDGGQTDYLAALRFLHERMAPDRIAIQTHGSNQNYRVDVARPLVFFITDGAPYAKDRYQRPDEWMPYRNLIVGGPGGARMAAIGLDGAHPRTLWSVATGEDDGRRNAFIALPATDPASRLSAGDSLAASVINVIERSIKLSVQAGEMVIEVPAGMRRVDG